MAGMGTRLRPITLTTPKPLVKIAGKSIVQRLIESLSSITPEKISDIGFVINPNFPKFVTEDLISICQKINVHPHFFYQNVPLGTAHAIFMAKELLYGPVIIAFADTLFISNSKLNLSDYNIIFTKTVDDPSQYGVVITDKNGLITKFVEKPKQPVSNKAITGIYFFNNAQNLLNQIKFLLDNDIKVKNEYQLTDALERMLNSGEKFTTYDIDQWLDCGNKNYLLNTTKIILQTIQNKEHTLNSDPINSVIIPPVYVGKNVNIKNSIIGPFASIEDNSTIENSIIENSIIFNNALVANFSLKNSLIGNHAKLLGQKFNIAASDYSEINF